MSDKISILGRKLLDRRHFLKQTTGVMGGLSQGKAIITNLDGTDCYHMTGNVTTENNGGFIQIRNQLKPSISVSYTHLTLPTIYSV